MDTINILISASISTGLYIFYKGSIHLYKNYYLKSTCHDNTLEITIMNNDEKKDDEKKEEEKKPDVNIV